MTPSELDAIQARADAATAGPWFSDYYPAGPCGAKVYREQIRRTYPEWVVACRPSAALNGPGKDARKQEVADAAFIAHARTDIPALVAEVRRLRGENGELRPYADGAKRILLVTEAIAEAGETSDGRDGRAVDSYIAVYEQQKEEIAKLRAANSQLEQELEALRSREMNLDDLASYSEDRANMKAESDRLRAALEAIVKHQKTVAGGMAHVSGVVAIAERALGECK